VENLWRQRRLMFVTALQVGPASLVPATYEVQGNPQRDATFTVVVHRDGQTRRVTCTGRRVVVHV
jgi:hypothetical protein